MKSYSINELLQSPPLNQKVEVNGWVKTFRSNRFIALNDGSTIQNIQCVVDFEQFDEELLKKIATGAALKISGVLVESLGKGQSVEIQAEEISVHGISDPDSYPIQPKKHSMEFLREHAHLRIRTNTFAAVMRVRSALSFAIHAYFQKNGFYYFHAPIITGSDAEGAGEMFRVSTLDPKNPPLTDNGDVNYKEDFFGKETNLTVSGQLEAEAYAMGLGKVYTFGPTFRAENSNTSRHLAEFWMIEPEMAFYDLKDNMDLAEDFIKNIISYLLENCEEDLAFLEKRLLDEEKTKPMAERSEMKLTDRLKFVVNNEFIRITYT
ncbi:MAG: asparagine--tRNA ligase, partial [Eudoraea sp.]|nr:asparagine--tRNA ligase [Eudoraea sp.]